MADGGDRADRKGGRPDTIYLPPQAQLALQTWKTKCPSPKWVFPSSRADQPISYNWSWRKVRDLGEVAGIDELHLHRLRHTFATEYRRQDPEDLLGLAESLGHTGIQNVTIYAQGDNQRRRRTISSLYSA